MSNRRGKKEGPIELAYRLAEAADIPLWCRGAAGFYLAIHHAGAGRRDGPHVPREVHGGTAKLLTLLRPTTGKICATGKIRAKRVTNTTNAVPPPWLQQELIAVLAALPPVTDPEDERRPLARWATWLGHGPRDPLPSLQLILIRDNLAGRLSCPIARRYAAVHAD